MLSTKVQHKKTLKTLSEPLANMRLGIIQALISVGCNVSKSSPKYWNWRIYYKKFKSDI